MLRYFFVAVGLTVAHAVVRTGLLVVLVAWYGWDTPPQGEALTNARMLQGLLVALTLPELATLDAFPTLAWDNTSWVIAAGNSLLYGVAGTATLWGVSRLRRRGRAVT